MTDKYDALYNYAYAMWRFQMWMSGYGSYAAINWAVRHRILTPLHVPSKTAGLRKWLIQTFCKLGGEG